MCVCACVLHFLILDNSNSFLPLAFICLTAPRCTLQVTVTITDSNDAPVIGSCSSRSIAENSAVYPASGSFVGSPVTVTDLDPADSHTFSIVSGNLRDSFGITPGGGQIYVKATGGLDYEETASYVLVVKVTDDGPGTLSSTCPITVNVINVNEAPQVSSTQVRYFNENTASNGDPLWANLCPDGTCCCDTMEGAKVVATDEDAGDTVALQYFITGSNANAMKALFTVNSTSTGALIFPKVIFNREATPSYTFEITVQDRGING